MHEKNKQAWGYPIEEAILKNNRFSEGYSTEEHFVGSLFYRIEGC